MLTDSLTDLIVRSQFIDDTIKKKGDGVELFGLALSSFYYLQEHESVQKIHPWSKYVRTHDSLTRTFIASFPFRYTRHILEV